MRTLLFLVLVGCRSQTAAPAPVETAPSTPPVASAAPSAIASAPVATASASATPTASVAISVTRSKDEIRRAKLQKDLEKQLEGMDLKTLAGTGGSGSTNITELPIEKSNAASVDQGGGGGLLVSGGGGHGGIAPLASSTRDR